MTEREVREAIRPKCNDLPVGEKALKMPDRILLGREGNREIFKSWVYFLEAERPEGKLIKIGYSTDLQVRFNTIGLDEKTNNMRVLGYAPGGLAAERALHYAYRKFRVSGEWFLPKQSIYKLARDCYSDGQFSDRHHKLFKAHADFEEALRVLRCAEFVTIIPRIGARLASRNV